MSAPEIQTAAPGAYTAATRPAVLLVDDETALLDVFAAALAENFEVFTARSIREAEAHLETRAFQVVVADNLLPGGDGLSFLIACRERFPAMQRVLASGYINAEMLLRSVHEAALFRYLPKPVLISELIKVVQNAAEIHDDGVVVH
jgi:DNA-binding NtrC family response regulator